MSLIYHNVLAMSKSLASGAIWQGIWLTDVFEKSAKIMCGIFDWVNYFE